MSVVSLLFKSARAHPNARVWLRYFGKVWHGQVGRLMHPYRPEVHYMRGPGPKCRAKGIDPKARDLD